MSLLFQRFWTIGFLLFSLIGEGFPLVNQPVVIDRLQVDLWPEYDGPDVLVTYRMTLSSESILPVQMIVRIPASVEAPESVLMQDADGVYYNLDYVMVRDGEWLKLIFISSSLDVRIEYYDPGLKHSMSGRSFEFIWPGDYEIRSATVQVQQPYNLTWLQINPDMGSGRVGKDGFTYYTTNIGALKQGEDFLVSLNYGKSDRASGPNLLRVYPLEPVTPHTRGRIMTEDLVVWFGSFLGILTIGVLYVTISNLRRGILPFRKDLSLILNEKPIEMIDGLYCPQCGRRAKEVDQYCQACGEKLVRS
jgi:hypothetical protein